VISAPAAEVAPQTTRHRVLRIERRPPVNKRPEVVDGLRLAATPVTDEAIALEDRGSKLLALGADVHAPTLVAI
jgi:hypothetical protein